MNPPDSHVILDLVLKSTAVLLLAFAAQTLRRRASAAQRGFIWLSAFAMLALLPLTLFVSPRIALDWLPQKKAVAPEVSLPEITMSAAMPDAIPAASRPASRPAWRPGAMETAAATWLAGMLLVLAHRAIGGVRLRQMLRRVKPVENASVQQRASELARECGTTRDIALLQSDAVPVPVTWGTVRPVLLLPDESLNWDAARLDAALRHELGHIRHLDSLKRLFAHIVCAAHWFNPLVWFAAKSWHIAQEQACDDFVLRGGADAESYAMQLLNVAQSLGASGFLPMPALAMARPSTLETRLTSIVDGSRDRRPPSAVVRFSGAACCLSLLALCATMQLRAVDKPPARPADSAGKGPTIMIETRIIEAPAGTVRSIMGGTAPAPGVSVITSLAQDADILQRLQDTKGADVLSAPRVTTISGQQAMIEVGRELAADPGDAKATVFEGVKLALLPTVAGANIVLDIDASIGAKIGEEKSRPIMRTRTVKSKITAGSGSTTILMAGNGVKEEGPTELLFFITAKVIEPKTDTVTTIESDPVTNKNTPAVRPAALEKAGKIVLGSVEFAEASPDEAADFFRVKSRELSSDKQGVNIILQHGPDSKNAKLTLSLHDIPLSEALRYVAALSGLELSADDNALILQPGAAARPKALEAAREPGKPKAGAAETRARSITLPSLEFQDATIDESVDFLRIKGRQLDPEKRGVNILVRHGAKTRDAKLTLSLRDIPLSEALGYIAALADMEVEADENTLVLKAKEVK